MGAHLDRAWLLFQQSRLDLAETELRAELAADPDGPVAHALLGLCLADREQHAEATAEAQAAIRLAPDMPIGHFVLARAMLGRNRYPEAVAAIEEAIRLNPDAADQFALLASIRFAQRNWSATLAVAEQGLALDPENVDCTNLRAMSLVKLGRREQAGATIGAALAKNPDNAFTHANQGWTLLHEREPKRAMEHFREALRLEPNLDWARQGIVEALKARKFIYRWMLAYFLWMSRLSSRAQWGIVIGGYIGYRLLGKLAADRPALAPWIMPFLIAYMVFAVMTWVADPLFNLLLRINRFGRLALSADQIKGSNLVGAGLLLALLALCAFSLTRDLTLLSTALIVGFMVLPLSAIYRCPPGRPRLVMVGYSALLGIAGLMVVGDGLLIAILGEDRLNAAIAKGGVVGSMLERLFQIGARYGLLATQVFFLGILLSAFVANYVMNMRPRR